MFKRYRWNFVFLVLGVSIIGFIIFDFIFYYSIKNYLYEQVFHEMRMKTQLAVELLEQNSLQSLRESQLELYEVTFKIRNIVNSRVTIIDSTGRVLTDSDVARDQVPLMDNHLNRPEVKNAITEGWGQSHRKSETVKRNIFYTAFPIKENEKTIAFLRLAYYSQRFEESMSDIIILILVGNLLGLLALFFAALYLGKLITAPILRIVRIAQKISSGDLKRSFPVRRHDEIGTLAMILNQLTDRLKTQINLISDERSKLHDILTNLDIGIIVIDEQKNIIHANPEIFRILDFENVEIERKNILEILRHEQLITAIDNILKEGKKETGEFEYFIKDRNVCLSYIVIPFLISEEKMTGALVQLQDITELKKLEAIRRDFVANASHELKTPLAAIVGYTETLLEGASEVSHSRMKFIRRIREQSQRLTFLVDDLLKLSELEREQPLEFKTCSLNPLIQETIKEFKEQLQQKNIDITFESPKNIRAWINEEGIRSVFNNLIDNAIKYTPQNGEINIKVNELENNRVKIEVADTGIGIDPKYHDRIFQRFYRIDKARSRTLGGTGLGLSIVKHIIERHDSKIHVESELGKGSCFWFELQQV